MTADTPEPPNQLVASLRGVAQEEYEQSYRDHALEIYKVYLEMADRISDRREKVNSFFLAVNTGIVAILSKDAFGGAGHADGLDLLVPIAGGVLCYLWHRIIRSY